MKIALYLREESPLVGGHLKPEQIPAWTSPQKMTLGGFEPEILREHFKVSSRHNKANLCGFKDSQLIYSLTVKRVEMQDVDLCS